MMLWHESFIRGVYLLQASELLQSWDTPPVDDALELLSGEFTNEVVRTYAVSLLRRSSDEVSACNHVVLPLGGFY